MNRRRSLLVQSTKSQLPAGYKQVEYLQTDEQGNAYIDTQYIYDIDSLISCTALISNRYKFVIFGLRSNAYKAVAMSSDTQVVLYYDRSIQNHRANSVPVQQNIIYKLKQHPEGLEVINTETNSSKWVRTDDNYKNDMNLSLYLFADNDRGTRVVKSRSLRIYSFSITKNNELVVNLVPCKDDKNVPCFYDTVRKITLYNSSTSGEFITGNEV